MQLKDFQEWLGRNVFYLFIFLETDQSVPERSNSYHCSTRCFCFFFLGAYTGTDGEHYSIGSMVKGSNNLFFQGVETMRRIVVLCPLFHYFGEFVPDCSSEVPKGFRGTVAEPW